MNKALLILSSVFYSILVYGNNPSVNYISKYKEIAISEMHRTGIPASIKMAQALLESGSGQSSLAKHANNHFGIKCGGKWNGGEFYREDDDYNSKGKLIKSCFRKFDSDYESFIAHSDFLQNQKRYNFLFEYTSSDYESWAYGLKKAGYATDKKYPKKLIDIIIKYRLYELDQGLTHPEYAQNETVDNQNQKDKLIISESNKKSHIPVDKPVDSVIASHRVNQDATYHTVLNGQSIAEISMLYDIDENNIRIRNRLPKDAEPLVGEKIFLRKKISLLKRPKFDRNPQNDIANNDDFIF